MITQELKDLFDEIKTEIALLKVEIVLISYDTEKIREELTSFKQELHQQLREPIGIAPGTPPPDFIPPEMM